MAHCPNLKVYDDVLMFLSPLAGHQETLGVKAELLQVEEVLLIDEMKLILHINKAGISGNGLVCIF